MEAAVLATPPRTHAQRMDALTHANRIRTHRKELKIELRTGRTPARAAFEDPLCDSMKVFDLLLALPKVGRVKANRVLNRARVSPSKTLGGLSDRQRKELLAMLPR